MGEQCPSATTRSDHLPSSLDSPSDLCIRLEKILKFILPVQTSFAFAGCARAQLPKGVNWNTWQVMPFPQFGGEATDERIVLSCLREFHTQGCDFLLLPQNLLSGLEKYAEVQLYLEQHCRRIFYDRELCAIYALQGIKNEPLRMTGAPDGLPLPPPEMIRLVSGLDNTAVFYWGGILAARWIKGILAKNALDINQFSTVLDFGCGCGRVMRHWQSLSGPQFFGTDYNPYLIAWCQRFLPFAAFQTNELVPPLPYADEQFDLLYTISIFTHLEERLQMLWMEELRRVLKPGGRLLLTVHGLTHLNQLNAEQRARFDSGELVVSRPEHSGDNECGAYHPESYVRRSLAKGFLVVDFIPGGAKDANQDVFLLQKPLA